MAFQPVDMSIGFRSAPGRRSGETNCPVCGITMVLVRIDPRVTLLSELRTFPLLCL
jgi:hypothetical protein